MSDIPVALVTGASRGIGRALALGLAEAGYLVLLVGRSRSSLEETARLIMKTYDLPAERVPHVVRLDLSRTDNIQEIIEPMIYRLGRIDVLVNNAGQWLGGTLDRSVKDYQRLLDINTMAPLVMVQSVVETMKEQGGGHIFNVASRAGKYGFPESGAYCTSKFALVGLSESLYRELTPLGIKVTALCPGWVNTTMGKEAGCPHDPELVIQPEDIMKTVQWLLSLSPGACVKEVLIESPVSII